MSNKLYSEQWVWLSGCAVYCSSIGTGSIRLLGEFVMLVGPKWGPRCSLLLAQFQRVV
jgi:hypothetical protein